MSLSVLLGLNISVWNPPICLRTRLARLFFGVLAPLPVDLDCFATQVVDVHDYTFDSRERKVGPDGGACSFLDPKPGKTNGSWTLEREMEMEHGEPDHRMLKLRWVLVKKNPLGIQKGWRIC